MDEESYSLHRYLDLFADGQTVATDLLFAPESAMTPPASDKWREIFENRHRLITKKSASFAGYCRVQANKYGAKGQRLASARKALDIIDRGISSHSPAEKLGVMRLAIDTASASDPHMSTTTIRMASGASVLHWEVCGRKLSFQSSLKVAREIIEAVIMQYGRRAAQAEDQKGVDWKALSHAVRVARQGVELLSTGAMVFPLRDAPYLLAIKKGMVPFEEVSNAIQQGLADIEAAASASTLPEEPDRDWIEDFVCRVYRDAVVENSYDAGYLRRP